MMWLLDGTDNGLGTLLYSWVSEREREREGEREIKTEIERVCVDVCATRLGG